MCVHPGSFVIVFVSILYWLAFITGGNDFSCSLRFVFMAMNALRSLALWSIGYVLMLGTHNGRDVNERYFLPLSCSLHNLSPSIHQRRNNRIHRRKNIPLQVLSPFHFVHARFGTVCLICVVPVLLLALYSYPSHLFFSPSRRPSPSSKAHCIVPSSVLLSR